MKKYILSLAIAAGLLGSTPTNAQTFREPVNYIGGYLHYNLNLHSADFSALPGYFSCCPKFESGSGSGFSIGGLFEIPLEEKFFLGIRLGYSVLNAELTREEIIGNSLDLRGGTDRVNVKYSIDSKLSAIAIEPQISYNFWDNFTGSLGLKGDIMTTKKFSQSEEIQSPANVVFQENGQRTRAAYADEDIPDAKSFLTFLTLGVSYNFKLESGLLISPEVRYELPLYSLSSVSWKPSALNLGLAARVPLRPSVRETYDSTFVTRDTTIKLVRVLTNSTPQLAGQSTEKSTIEYDDYTLNRTDIFEHYTLETLSLPAPPKVDLTVRGIDAAGSYTDLTQLVIEEVATEESFPLLPQVFFPNGSDKIAGINLISENETASFTTDSLEWDAVKIYADVLNIVGKRMLENPKAKLTITGCNNDTEIESGNLELSENRAKAVKNYLTNTWKIASNRLIIEKRNLPENAANNKRPQGLEENRRVDLSSNNAEILRPITLSEIRRTANPPIVRLISKVETEDRALQNWDITISQQGQTLRRYNGYGYPDSIDWTVEVLPVPMNDSPTKATLIARDTYNQAGEDTETISIEQKTIRRKQVEMLGDKRLDRFSLILFDYDKSDVPERQASLIKEIKSKIQPNSKVVISGFTDLTGDKAYNKRLAKQRAENIMNALGVSNAQTEVISVGGEYELHDNSTPAGRSLSRTVRVVIETPVK